MGQPHQSRSFWGVWRRSRRSLWQYLGFFLGCCLLVVSCSSDRPSTSSSSPSATDSNRIVLGTTAKVRTLDPADATEILASNLLYNLGDRLYAYKPGTNELQPQLATALPTVSDDGLTYTIPVREGVTFHDGEPFNAEAMAFSLRRFIENGGQPAFLLADIVESVEATGDYELTIKLQKPFAAFPNLLTISGTCAVSPKAYAIGAGQFKPDTFVGTGPYKLAQYNTDSLRFDAFEGYWGEKPSNDGVDIQIFSSPANLFNTFRTRGVDVAYQNLDLDQIRTLQQGAQQGGWQVIEGNGNGIHYVSLNVLSEPLDKLEVRQAIAAAIDRPLLRDRVFQGQVEPLYSLLPNTLDASDPTFQTAYGDANKAKALELLQKAGYSKENPLTIEFWYRANLTSNALAATTLKAAVEQSLEGALIFDLKSVEAATAYQNLDKGIYPTFLLDWAPDFFDADNYIQPFLACAQGSAEQGCQEGSTKSQGSFYYNARMNELIDQQRQAQNAGDRQKLLEEIQTITAQDVPFIPLWQNKEFLFVQQGVSGAELDPTQRVALWTIRKSPA